MASFRSSVRRSRNDMEISLVYGGSRENTASSLLSQIEPCGGFASGWRSMMRETAACPEGGAHMTVQPTRVQRATGILLGAAVLLMVAGCSSKEPKPMAQPTPDQVRGHADRGFDNLKKEE